MKKRNRLVSEPNYYTTKHISENVLIIEMKKKEVKMNKPIYLHMSTLYISKTLTYEFWYDYIKPEYGEREKLCYTDTTVLLFVLKLKIFIKTLLMMLKDGSIHLTVMKMIKDHFQ